MSTIKGPDVISHARQGQYDSAWRGGFASTDDTLAPAYYGQLANRYGGLLLWDATMLAGRDIDVSTRNMIVLEKGYFLDTIDVATQIEPAAANADITLKSVKNVLRVGFVVHIPSKYLLSAEIPQSFRCLSKTWDTGTSQWWHVLEPLVTGQRVIVAIPVTQALTVGGSMFAAGTQQPAGMVDEFFHSNYGTRILKESVYWEGGQGALKELAELGQGNLRARTILDSQMRLRVQLNDAILMGYKITHPGGLTQNNEAGVANTILSSAGLLPTMVAESMKLYYTGTFSEDQFDQIPFLMLSQGVAGNSAMIMVGMELGLGIEKTMLNFVKEYSGGSDLYDKMKGVGFGIREYTSNGFINRIVRLPEFSNPVMYGAPGYNFEALGMVFPDAKVTAKTTSLSPDGSSAEASKVRAINNFTLGYLNYGGENRRLISGDKAGVNGYGIPFSSDWDNSAHYTLCEMMNIFVGMNQTGLILRTDA